MMIMEKFVHLKKMKKKNRYKVNVDEHFRFQCSRWRRKETLDMHSCETEKVENVKTFAKEKLFLQYFCFSHFRSLVLFSHHHTTGKKNLPSQKKIFSLLDSSWTWMRKVNEGRRRVKLKIEDGNEIQLDSWHKSLNSIMGWPSAESALELD